MATVEQVRAELESQLLQLAGVTGVGVGQMETGEPCLVIYTPREADAPVDTLRALLGKTPWQLKAIGEVTSEAQ
jgi:hypothetical protein